MDTWEESLHIVHDTEMKARIDGIVPQMQTLDFAFGTVHGLATRIPPIFRGSLPARGLKHN